MLPLLLLAAAAPQAMSALDAERAFDLAAADKGQWTAFREFAAPDAVMFVPQPVNAQSFLKDRRDPPEPVRWQPETSYVSCDGKVAINTGAWQRPDGSAGYFTTVWRREPDGRWKWILDHGDTLATQRGADAPPVERKAACNVPHFTRSPDPEGLHSGEAADHSLNWAWQVMPDGSREVAAFMWDGRKWARVINNEVAAPPPPAPKP
ncbi:MAG: DUF4440 domain-containing protein [Sphingomonas sp.]|jgi:ketosteroid isomerase-like protein|uniref:YybH family protein n=1 Tax=Sphingomonas sp. TaxID=28214 RepID=UPI0035671C40